MSLEEFIHDRNIALISLDEATIVAYMEKYEIEIPRPEVFWASVHKAITGCTQLSWEFRRQSALWLKERGFKSLDDGELKI